MELYPRLFWKTNQGVESLPVKKMCHNEKWKRRFFVSRVTGEFSHRLTREQPKRPKLPDEFALEIIKGKAGRVDHARRRLTACHH